MRLHTVLAVVLQVVPGFFPLSTSSAHAQATSTLTATLAGSVTDPSGAAIQGAQVSAQPLSSSGSAIRATTGADGRFVLKFAAGKYRASLSHPSFEGVQQEFTLADGETHEWDVRMVLARLAASVVVTAEAEPVPAESTTASVNIITRQEIDQRQEIWLAPMLAATPGVSLGRTGPLGGITSLFLDGGNFNFTKVLIDGTSVNQPGGDIDFVTFSLDNIDKIEVVHGASSALFGSDAMTGVIQIFTHRGSTLAPELELLGEGGTFATGRGMGRLSGLAGRFDYSASASYFSSDGQGPNDRFRDTTLSGNFGWRFTDADKLRLSLRSSASDAGEPGQTLLLPANLAANNSYHDFSANLGWDLATGEHWHHHLAGAESYIRLLVVSPPFHALDRFNRTGLDEQSSYLFPSGAVSLGYAYEVENGAPNGPHVRRNNQGGYIDARYQFGRRLTLTAGGRAEANASFGTRVVPRAGVAYALRFGHEFWGATRLRASYGLGIKEPDLIQSFEHDPCAPGNPSLKPERSETFHAGVEQLLASDRFRFSLDFFHNYFRDIVSFTSTGGPTSACPFGAGTFFNTDAARAYGANTALEARLARWLRLTGNYTYDNSRVLRAPSAFDPVLAPGNRLFRRPLHSGNLIVNAAVRRMNWNLAGYYVGRRTDSDFLGLGLTSNPSYVRWDLATSYDLSRRLAFLGRVENLFNRHYQDANIGYPALRLNYRAGIKFTWGAE